MVLISNLSTHLAQPIVAAPVARGGIVPMPPTGSIAKVTGG
jgi:hypothetical protein